MCLDLGALLPSHVNNGSLLPLPPVNESSAGHQSTIVVVIQDGNGVVIPIVIGSYSHHPIVIQELGQLKCVHLAMTLACFCNNNNTVVITITERGSNCNK